ncbi:coiled-coil domain-containing protein [Hymenobacter lapidiphilus]|uniref:Phage tail tape measure protein n=1 Tax=Hymenobacter lapidiphilus TaxID=2608003 RepID=A0A7Y7PT26_9BACT|nr:hypothetical protein [Hymenobacter lapidiphilus]NVO33274.1 hypothetical protein [Hymenobacter lapidiphilus]
MPAQETITLQVDIQANTARIVELQKQLLDTKSANTELNKSFKEGRITQDELAAGQVRLKQKTADITTEQRALTKANEEQVKVNQALTAATGNTTAKTASFGATLRATAKENSLLNSVMGQASGVQARFTQAQDLAKSALGGTTTATNLFKVSLLALPIFAIVAGLTALYTYLTRTQEGLDFVERKTKGVTVVLGVLTDKVSAVGKLLFDAFSNPKQAAADLVDFLQTNLLNRLKAFGVLVEAISSGDVGKLRDGFIQLGTGVTDATAKTKAFTAELYESAKAGEAIAKVSQQLRDEERSLNVERAKSRAQVEGLKFLAEDQSKSSAARVAASKQAFAIEQEQERKAIDLQQRRIDNLRKEQGLTNNLTADNQNLAEQEIKLSGIQEAARTRQIELNNKVVEIQKSAAAANKAANDAALKQTQERAQKELEARKQLLQGEIALLDERLRTVETNSDEELRIRSEKLKSAYALELAQEKLTAEQKTVLSVKFENDKSDLEQSFFRRRAAAAADADADVLRRRLLLARTGSAEYLAIEQELIGKELQIQILALDEKSNNKAKAALLTTQAEQRQQENRFKQASDAAQGFLDSQQEALERARAKGEITEDAYQRGVYLNERASVEARIQLAKRFNKDTVELTKQRTKLEIGQIKQVADQEDKINRGRADAAAAFGTELGNLFAATLLDSGATAEAFFGKLLILILDSLQKTVLAAQVEATVKAIGASPGPIGFIKAAASVAAITIAFESVKGIIGQQTTKQFADGGFVSGPGGPKDDAIPAMLSNGESVINARSTSMYGPVLSWINEMGGGKGWARYATGGFAGAAPPTPIFDGGFAQRAASEMPPPLDYDLLGKTLAKYMPTEIGFRSFIKAREGYEAPRNKSSIGRKSS